MMKKFQKTLICLLVSFSATSIPASVFALDIDTIKSISEAHYPEGFELTKVTSSTTQGHYTVDGETIVFKTTVLNNYVTQMVFGNPENLITMTATEIQESMVSLQQRLKLDIEVNNGSVNFTKKNIEMYPATAKHITAEVGFQKAQTGHNGYLIRMLEFLGRAEVGHEWTTGMAFN